MGWSSFFKAISIVGVLMLIAYVLDDRASGHEAILREKERIARTPQVIREADGCKVYRFKDGDYFHYYTRCKESVVTESNRTECHTVGKTRQCVNKSEEIETITE